MNFEYFIAKRIIESKAYKSSISAPIIKIGITAIAVGIIVMMIAIATGIGLQKKIREKVVAFNGHITLSNFDKNNSQESVKPIPKKQEFYPEFKNVKGIKHIQGVATKSGIIRLEHDFEHVFIKGVGSDYNWEYIKEYLVAGRIPDYTKKRNQEVMISQYLAKRLKFNVGSKFNTYFRKDDLDKPPSIITYEVVGIYNSGFKEFDEQYVIGDIRHIIRLNKWPKETVGNFEIFIDNYNDLDRKSIEVYQNTSSLLNTEAVNRRYAGIFDWINIFDNNIYGIIGIMILIAGFNMITALLVLILERTQMIGVLKALGSNNWSIRKVFLYNATYLIIIGLFWGNLIGLSLLLLQKYFNIIPLNPEEYHVNSVPVYLSAFYITTLNIGTFILCLIMLLIPSYIVTRISPVKAIRFD